MLSDKLREIQSQCDPESDLYQGIEGYLYQKAAGNDEEAANLLFYVGFCYAGHTGLREKQLMDYYRTLVHKEKRSRRKDTPADIIEAVRAEGKRLDQLHEWTRRKIAREIYNADNNLGRAIRHHVQDIQSVDDWLKPVIPSRNTRQK